MAAVAYLFFNRPRLTRRSFDSIRSYQPDRLFLIADGPRTDRPMDDELCRESRAIVDDIDWVCDVTRIYSDSNLGIRNRIGSGLDHVFRNVEKAIVLEDDCLPHPDFFSFCDELLDRYEQEQRVMSITGDNFQRGKVRGEASYYFSRYPHVWGWATWRRAWDQYDIDMNYWPSWSESHEWETLLPPAARVYWKSVFDRVRHGSIDTWAYQWLAVCLFKGGLTATPNVNLVENIGFGEAATHTKNPHSEARVKAAPLGKISHPNTISPDDEADAYTFRNHFRRANLLRRGINRLRNSIAGD